VTTAERVAAEKARRNAKRNRSGKGMYDALTADEIKELDRKMWSAFRNADNVWTNGFYRNPIVQEIAEIGDEITRFRFGY
jgi:hypothetical protein